MERLEDFLNQKDRSTMGWITAFALGSLLGASLAILMAPKSGEETRSLLMEKSGSLKSRTVDGLGDTTAKAKEAIGDLAHTTKDRVKSLAGRSKEMAQEEKAHLESKVQDAKDALSY